VGDNVAASLGSGRRRPFTYKTLGAFVDMGRFKAVARTVGFKWRGFPAWWLARTYHVSQLPGIDRKLRLVADSTVSLLFPRDSAELGQLGHPPRLGDDPGLGGVGEWSGAPAAPAGRAGAGAPERATATGGGERATGAGGGADGREEMETGSGGRETRDAARGSRARTG
jgi:NADH dehydrogenase